MFKTYVTKYCEWCQGANHSADGCAREHQHSYTTPAWGHPVSVCACGDEVPNAW